jgi:hypothetical protein
LSQGVFVFSFIGVFAFAVAVVFAFIPGFYPHSK